MYFSYYIQITHNKQHTKTIMLNPQVAACIGPCLSHATYKEEIVSLSWYLAMRAWEYNCS